MRPVVSDCGPLHYLVLIEAVELLPEQFGRVLIPEAVAIELSHQATPSAVRSWLETAPAWLDRRSDPGAPDFAAPSHRAGERAAIELAISANARLLLIDDRVADIAARARGLETTGTLGVLIRAAQIGQIDLRTTFERLRETNFRCRPEMLDTLLAKYAER